MPQSHPTTGPARFLSPARFLARKAKWSAHRNFRSVLFLWSHQATGPVWLDTAVHGWIIRRTPWLSCAMPVQHHTGLTQESSMFFISYETCAGPSRVPHNTLADTSGNWHNQNWQKSHTGVVFGRTGPHRPITGCLRSQNPYGARKLIMHALKLYGPHKERQNSYGAARCTCGPREWTYDFVQNSPGTACTGPGVWCDRSITRNQLDPNNQDTSKLGIWYLGPNAHLFCEFSEHFWVAWKRRVECRSWFMADEVDISGFFSPVRFPTLISA